MPKEMREYENQEMESTESPVPQEDEEHTVENIQEEHLKSWELTDSEKRRIQEETASITTKVSTQTKTKARTENIRM